MQAKELSSRNQMSFFTFFFPLLSPAMIHPGFCPENKGNPIGLGQLTSWTLNILAKHQPNGLLSNRLSFHSWHTLVSGETYDVCEEMPFSMWILTVM